MFFLDLSEMLINQYYLPLSLDKWKSYHNGQFLRNYNNDFFSKKLLKMQEMAFPIQRVNYERYKMPVKVYKVNY